MEQLIFPPDVVQVVSLLFLPFGVKVIFAVLGGGKSIVPIFLAHVITNIYLDKDVVSVFLGALVGLAIIYLPIALINRLIHKPLLSEINLRDSNINLFRFVMSLAVIASVLNALIHSVIFQGVDIDLLAFRFVIGDLGGTVALFLLLVSVKQQLVNLMKFVSVKVESK